MAILISKADGDLTASGVFAAADTGSGATKLIRNNSTSLSAGVTSTSPSFTVANGSVIDAVLLWVTRNATATTSTFKVDLLKGGVSQASVTVNKSDLPDNTNARPVPVLFVLDNTATGDGGSNWTIAVTLAGSGSITYYRASSSGFDFTRALRTTTGVTASAGDDIVIVGEMTSAGGYTERTVHMDSTAATVYGSGAVNTTTVSGGQFIVAFHASLIFDNDAATDYVLRLAADLLLYMGTLSIGTSSDPIPYDGTAVLEFQQVSTSGDFGLRLYDNSTLTSRGSPRTPGKEIVSCKLTADTPVDNMTATRGITGASTMSGTNVNIVNDVSLDSSKTTLALRSVAATTPNTTHGMYCSVASQPASQSHVFAVYVERGSGTSNRYVRFLAGSSLSLLPTNAIYADFDLQTGTVVTTATSRGNGAVTSADIIPLNDGFLLVLVGTPMSATSAYQICLFSGNTFPVSTYAGDNSINFYASDFYDFYGTSMPSATLSVDTDTGWLAGDVVAVASTTRVSSDGEVLQLESDATSSTLPMNKVYNNNHSGTSPAQAEVILLTRNVRIRSTSPTLHTYVWMTGTAVIDVAWTEIYYASSTTISSDSVTKCLSIEGVNSGTAGQKSFTYNSIHDCNTNTIYVPSIWSSLNLNVSYNVFWRAGSGSSTDTIQISNNGLTATDWVFDHNIILRPGRYGMNLAAVGGTVTNNTIAGGSHGLFLTPVNTAILGTFDSNTIHSVNGQGLIHSGGNGVIANMTIWRTDSASGAINISQNAELVFDGLDIFGADARCMTIASASNIKIKNGHLTGETDYSTTTTFYASDNVNMVLENVSTEADGPRVPADRMFELALNMRIDMNVSANNCILDYTEDFIHNKEILMSTSFISSNKHGQVSGDHRTYTLYGNTQSDAVNYRTASPSMRLIPSSATDKAVSGQYGKGKLTAVPNGGQVDILTYVRKSLGGGCWNPADATDNITVSNNNLTVAAPATAGIRGARPHTSGKYYIEFTSVAGILAFGSFGIATIDAILNNMITMSDGFGVSYSGSIWYDGVSSGTNLGAISAGSVIGIAIDLDNMRGWARSGSGNWNNNAAHDPATNTGGFDISTVFAAKAAYPLANPAQGDLTANFGGSAFAYTPPTGFGAWDTSGSSDTADYNGNQPRLVQRANPALGQDDDVVIATASGALGDWELLSGTSSVATDDGAFEFYVDCDGTAGFINIDDWAATPHV